MSRVPDYFGDLNGDPNFENCLHTVPNERIFRSARLVKCTRAASDERFPQKESQNVYIAYLLRHLILEPRTLLSVHFTSRTRAFTRRRTLE